MKMDNEKLIKLVRNYKILYDLSDSKYSDKQRKEEAWRNIGKQLNVHKQDCKKAWTLLRDAFRRAVKKTKESKSGQAGMLTKKWKYEDEMSFLLPFFKERPTLCTVQYENESVSSEDSETIENFPNEEANLDSPEPIPVESVLENALNQTSQTTTPLSKRKKISTQPTPIETAASTLVKYILQNNEKPADDIEQFFNCISTTVKSFPLKDRAVAKARVFSVISEMELEILNRNTYKIDKDSQTSSETAILK